MARPHTGCTSMLLLLLLRGTHIYISGGPVPEQRVSSECLLEGTYQTVSLQCAPDEMISVTHAYRAKSLDPLVCNTAPTLPTSADDCIQHRAFYTENFRRGANLLSSFNIPIGFDAMSLCGAVYDDGTPYFTVTFQCWPKVGPDGASLAPISLLATATSIKHTGSRLHLTTQGYHDPAALVANTLCTISRDANVNIIVHILDVQVEHELTGNDGTYHVRVGTETVQAANGLETGTIVVEGGNTPGYTTLVIYRNTPIIPQDTAVWIYIAGEDWSSGEEHDLVLICGPDESVVYTTPQDWVFISPTGHQPQAMYTQDHNTKVFATTVFPTPTTTHPTFNTPTLRPPSSKTGMLVAGCVAGVALVVVVIVVTLVCAKRMKKNTHDSMYACIDGVGMGQIITQRPERQANVYGSATAAAAQAEAGHVWSTQSAATGPAMPLAAAACMSHSMRQQHAEQAAKGLPAVAGPADTSQLGACGGTDLPLPDKSTDMTAACHAANFANERREQYSTSSHKEGLELSVKL